MVAITIWARFGSDESRTIYDRLIVEWLARGRRPHRNGRDETGMTTARRRAIDAIAQRLNLGAAAECHREFGLDLARLTVREASAMIDHLKALEQPAAATQNGGGR